MRALIVDDDREFCEEACDLLGDVGFECASLSIPAELRAFRQAELDVALIDLQMPGTDGFGAIELLWQSGARPNIILISGEAADILRTASDYAKSMGFTVLGTLTKPIDVPRMLALVAAMREEAPPVHTPSCIVPAPAARGFEAIQTFFQPQVSLLDGTVRSAEALARWLDDDGRELGPASFLPQIASSGKMTAFTWWITRAALEGCRNWHKRGLVAGVSVNWNAEMLMEPEAVSQLDSLREEAGLEAGLVTIELLEGSAVSSAPRALAALGRLRLLGYRIALDDFGCARSNFDQLVRLPLNEIKIDQSLVQGAMRWSAERSAIAAICRTAEELGITCVAEGIETVEQARMMQDIGCDMGQGFLFAKALPACQLAEAAQKGFSSLIAPAPVLM
jgi:EAL domain-containing protein (putative c-di-GMP-specific phosphodiesterase class I)